MNETDIKNIVTKQRAFFHTGATLDVNFRIQALKRLKLCIQKQERAISEAIQKDLGKSGFESYMCETGLTLSEISYMIRHIRSFSREKPCIPRWRSSIPGAIPSRPLTASCSS